MIDQKRNMHIQATRGHINLFYVAPVVNGIRIHALSNVRGLLGARRDSTQHARSDKNRRGDEESFREAHVFLLDIGH
jgi:hypothetical protein